MCGSVDEIPTQFQTVSGYHKPVLWLTPQWSLGCDHFRGGSLSIIHSDTPSSYLLLITHINQQRSRKPVASFHHDSPSILVNISPYREKWFCGRAKNLM